LTAVVKAGYTRIGFIDGAIEDGSRLPLRELKEALAVPRVDLFGGASMGAIRAARLESAGMRGIGRVFRLFRRRCLTDSEEVYALHAPAALHYRCLTLPLVNVRYTLRSMRRAGHVDRSEESSIMRYMREVPWFDRDRHSLSTAVYETCGRARSGSVTRAFESSYRDIKREDALLVLRRCLATSPS
jgi:hypothetical protein